MRRLIRRLPKGLRAPAGIALLVSPAFTIGAWFDWRRTLYMLAVIGLYVALVHVVILLWEERN